MLTPSRRWFAVPWTLLAALSIVATCRGADPSLAAVLAAHRATLRWNGDHPTGPAMDQLLAEAKASQFFLVGEFHGGVEPPRLTAALFRAFQPFGYHHLAVEMGPITTARLETLARSPHGLDAIRDLSVHSPFALMFEGWREEAALLVDAVHVARLPAAQAAVWGLDQEFIFSGRLHFDRLAQLAATPVSRVAWWRRMRTRALAGEIFPHTAASAPPFLLTATPADFDRLAAAFPGEGEAARLVAELRASARVYQEAHAGDVGRASLDRAALLQRHFDEDYSAGRDPRANRFPASCSSSATIICCVVVQLRGRVRPRFLPAQIGRPSRPAHLPPAAPRARRSSQHPPRHLRPTRVPPRSLYRSRRHGTWSSTPRPLLAAAPVGRVDAARPATGASASSRPSRVKTGDTF